MQQKEEVHLEAHQIFAKKKFEDRPIYVSFFESLSLLETLKSLSSLASLDFFDLPFRAYPFTCQVRLSSSTIVSAQVV